MVCDEPFGRRQHALVGGHEPSACLAFVEGCAEHRIPDEAQERVDRTIGDVADGCVRRTAEREELREWQTRIEQRQAGAHRLSIRR